jgi:hypothetical protein
VFHSNKDLRAKAFWAALGAVALGIAGLWGAVPALGSPASTKPSPGCNVTEYRQLDFWLGDWDTFDSDDTTTSVARAHVDLIAAGCAVHELYEQTDGLIGDSILSFDPGRKLWQQTWVTNYGSLMVISGRFKEGVLTLDGTMHFGNGKSLQQRITWKASGGGVRESSVTSKDGGKTWDPAFDVLFLKHH